MQCAVAAQQAHNNIVPIVTDVTIACSVHLSHLCTLLKPRQNVVPFGRDANVVPSSAVLDRCPSLPQEGEIRVLECPVHSNAAYRQVTLAVVVMRLIRHFCARQHIC